MDYESILSGLSVAGALTAFAGAAALIALVGFGKWAAKMVAGFFGG